MAESSNVLHPRALVPWVSSTSLLTNFMEKFDGNYTLEILVWATSFVPLRMTLGLSEEPGIERKPAFTRLSVKGELRAETGMGFLTPINRIHG